MNMILSLIIFKLISRLFLVFLAVRIYIFLSNAIQALTRSWGLGYRDKARATSARSGAGTVNDRSSSERVGNPPKIVVPPIDMARSGNLQVAGSEPILASPSHIPPQPSATSTPEAEPQNGIDHTTPHDSQQSTPIPTLKASAPAVPPRPYSPGSSRPKPHQQHQQYPNLNPGPPPPLPPVPADLRTQTQRYNTPSPYEYAESPPHFENPMIAPRPHRSNPSIPANYAHFLFMFLMFQWKPLEVHVYVGSCREPCCLCLLHNLCKYIRLWIVRGSLLGISSTMFGLYSSPAFHLTRPPFPLCHSKCPYMTFDRGSVHSLPH
ncbi:hypothetical protein BJ165DRAFT_1616078 [Panaeolus papilionaceus]|nr:hypothetical protein BJ165DRAFT_1616078 [Panaeolus papilionaceus]